jgi:hypothetical protein
MRGSQNDFRDLVKELTQVEIRWDQAIAAAFLTFENRYATHAALLLRVTGSRRKAEHWMCLHRRSFGDRSAYDVLAEDGADLVWEEINRACDLVELLKPWIKGCAY